MQCNIAIDVHRHIVCVNRKHKYVAMITTKETKVQEDSVSEH